ncbi:MAG: hypothetical protein WD334_07575, partial [Chitinophagales bacterium]
RSIMRQTMSALIIILLFSATAFAQSDVKEEKAEIKPAVKTQDAKTKQAEKNTSTIYKKDVQAEKVAKSSEKIEVKERKAAESDAVIKKEATIKNPKIKESEKAVEKKAVKSNTGTIQKDTKSNPEQ